MNINAKNNIPVPAPLPVVSQKQRMVISLTSAQQNITLNDSIAFKKLNITHYAIKGATTTGGIPDHTLFYIRMRGDNINQGQWINSNGGIQGVPLFLDGAFTSRSLSPPLSFLEQPNPIRFKSSILFEVRDSTGSVSAVFSELVLSLEAE